MHVRNVTLFERPLFLDCGYVWSACIVQLEYGSLCKLQLLIRPCLLVGAMEVHVAAVHQPCSAKCVILQIGGPALQLMRHEMSHGVAWKHVGQDMQPLA